MRAASILLAVLIAGAARAADGDAFSFALIGDLGYRPDQEPMVERVFAGLATERLSFVVHDGDLGSPSNGSCTNKHWSRRFAQFEASPQPLVYTPGDNEWTDCHAADGAAGLRAARAPARAARALLRARDELRPADDGAHPPGGYPENARWTMGGITFVTLHVVGSNNGRGRTSEGDAEFAARTAADIAWMREGFAAAKRRTIAP